MVLDEVQQYIGEDSQRSIDVQEVVEACCKNIGAKMLFIGTGQTAVTGTSNLKKPEGRFTVRVELSDADVDAVIRKVILAKKPEAKAPVEKVMQTNLGRSRATWPAPPSVTAPTTFNSSRRTTRSCRCAAASGRAPCACWTRPAPTASCATSSR